MPPSSSGHAAEFEALAAFKRSVPGVKLKKNEGRGGDDVFPIEVRILITSSSLPPAAAAFDLPLPATLLASVALRDEHAAAAAGGGAGGGESNLSISIASFECEGLARNVLDRATAGLRAAVSSSSSTSSFPLAALPTAAGAVLFAAVQSLAEIEPYETVDASGASARRFAVVGEGVEAVAGGQQEKAKASPPAEAAAPAKPEPTMRTPFLPQKVSSSPAEAEMRFLERRFGASLSILREQEKQVKEEGENGSSSGQQQEAERSQRRRLFRVSGFTPSDPSWRSGPVDLLGTIDFASYPAPGSFSLFAEAEEGEDEEDDGGRVGGGGSGGSVSSSVAAARLTLALRRAAATAPSASVAAGGDRALRSLVRLADSRGGEISAAPEFSLDDDDDGDGGGGEEGSSGSSDGDTASSSDSESEDGMDPAAPSPSSSSSPAASASAGTRFALSLASLSLDGVEALSPASLSLELSCRRCSAAVLPPALPSPGDSSPAASCSSSSPPSPLRECGTCRAPLSVALLPRVAHASSSVVAVVRCLGCVPKDLLLPASSFGAQCERCSRVAALRGATASAPGGSGGGGGGRRNFALRRPCPSCHAALAVLFEGCAFERMPEAGGGAGGGGGGGMGARRKKKNSKAASGDPSDGDGGARGKAKASGGAPLPRNGACDHYPHSRRAMRFPCCGRLFPCDVCHELSAAADPRHPHEVASVAARMVCGFCSKEQAFEKKGDPAVCRGCGKHLAGSSRFGSHGSGTRHWEGGQGCRDPKKLDRRDSKKHSGSRLKTRSKKAFRVGAGAAAAAKKTKK